VKIQGGAQIAVQQRERGPRETAAGAGDAEGAGQRAQWKLAEQSDAERPEERRQDREASRQVP
jgi:hypothetical protein